MRYLEHYAKFHDVSYSHHYYWHLNYRRKKNLNIIPLWRELNRHHSRKYRTAGRGGRRETREAR